MSGSGYRCRFVCVTAIGLGSGGAAAAASLDAWRTGGAQKTGQEKC